jgi:hypothetical protein
VWSQQLDAAIAAAVPLVSAILGAELYAERARMKSMGLTSNSLQKTLRRMFTRSLKRPIVDWLQSGR